VTRQLVVAVHKATSDANEWIIRSSTCMDVILITINYFLYFILIFFLLFFYSFFLSLSLLLCSCGFLLHLCRLHTWQNIWLCLTTEIICASVMCVPRLCRLHHIQKKIGFA
jgi:hypothetical protein